MFDLSLTRAPTSQRQSFLATKAIAPQRLGSEIERDLAHLASGTAAAEPCSLQRGLFVDLKALWAHVAFAGIAGRFALLAAVWSSTQLFNGGTAGAAAAGIAFGYLFFQIAGAGFTYYSDVARGRLAQATELYLMAAINRKLLKLDPARTTLTSGTLKNLVTSDVAYFSEFISSLTWNLTPALASVVVLGPVVLYLAGIPGLVGIITAFMSVPLALVFSKTIEKKQTKKQEHLDAIATVCGEWLRNMRLARYLGWQGAFQRDIAAHLRRYMKVFLARHAMLCLTFGISFSWWMVPLFAILLTSKLLHRPVDLKGFFATLWIIKDLAEYLQHLPHAINLLATSKACLKRIEALAAEPELAFVLKPSTEPAIAAPPVAIALRGVTAGYPGKEALKNLNLTFDLRTKTAVIGIVGSGKTTLLKVLAGDLVPTAGTVWITFADGSEGDLWDQRIYASYRKMIAYVPQEPFISNANVATNISLEDAPGVATPALSAAAARAELEPDLRMLAHGFATEIGEAGVNLSGGQRQRVNIARAFYADRPVLLLDDPLSAVDAKTEGALVTALLDRAQGFVLVSHRLGQLHRVERVITLEDGFVRLDGGPDPSWAEAHSEEKSESAPPHVATPPPPKAEDAYNVQENWKTLKRFAGSLTLLRRYFPGILLLIIVASCLPQVYLWYIGELVRCDGKAGCGTLSTLAGIATLGIAMRISAWVAFELTGQWSTNALHDKMIARLASARATWFDETPSGHVINRILGDFTSLRMMGVIRLGDASNAITEVFASAALVVFVNPWPALGIIPVTLLFMRMQLAIGPMLGHAQEIASQLKGEVLHRETDLIEGRRIFALYDKEPALLGRLAKAVRALTHARILSARIGAYARLWVRILSAGYGFVVVLFLALAVGAGRIGLPLAAVIMSAMFALTASFGWLSWCLTYMTETLGNARRVFALTDLPLETDIERAAGLAVAKKVDGTPVLGGDIVFHDYRMCYRPGLGEVLKGLSLTIPAGKRVGVIGRTGAGKSSLVQALFRMVHVTGGDVTIGGQSIYGLDVDHVRDAFGVVPQDPYLFAGTIATNLDRSGIHDPVRLAEALKTVGLNMPLATKIAEGGRNLSVGERQLICLTRILLDRKSYILMDEPTSSVDQATDAIVQGLLATAFRDRTVVTIAHRLETLRSYDMILELGAGQLLRSGPPELFLS